MPDFRSRIAKFYRYRVLPKVSDFSGAIMVNRKLKNWALKNVEEADEEPESIFGKGNWDNLLILDACRHDLYEEVKGETDSRVTAGSHSREFIEKTFSEGDFSDVVYVTGNVHFADEKFHESTGRYPDDVFQEIFRTFEDDWDDEHGVVLPEPLMRDARTARKLFPEKKIIVHFMQPHHPFVKSDKEYRDKDDMVWNLAGKGEVDREVVWNDYKENLEFVMEEIQPLIDDLEGRTVITSDHGNLAGENGLYHHPYGADAEALRKVPWDVVKED